MAVSNPNLEQGQGLKASHRLLQTNLYRRSEESPSRRRYTSRGALLEERLGSGGSDGRRGTVTAAARSARRDQRLLSRYKLARISAETSEYVLCVLFTPPFRIRALINRLQQRGIVVCFYLLKVSCCKQVLAVRLTLAVNRDIITQLKGIQPTQKLIKNRF